MNKTSDFDLISIGRVAVDMYSEQMGASLENASHFAKYLGGSSGNLAFGVARLGLKSAMLSRVGDEQLGRFVKKRLEEQGCDTSQLKVDSERLTAIAFLGIENRETFPLLFYRENCADMALTEADIDPLFISRSAILAVTGTHFSKPNTAAALAKAIQCANDAKVKTVLDIDYRPVLWGLTAKGEGANRFVESQKVTEHIQKMLAQFDLIVGTEEEFMLAGGSQNLIESLKTVRARSQAVLVLKQGSKGVSVFENQIPNQIDENKTVKGYTVPVMNVLGAGDAFLAGFLSAWRNGKSWEECSRWGNACGALVVSRHACSEAMPNMRELLYFLENKDAFEVESKRHRLFRLHRVATRTRQHQDLHVLAFDHRVQLFDMARECGASVEKISKLKQLLFGAADQCALNSAATKGVILDDHYASETVMSASQSQMWLARPVELPGSNPLQFEQGASVATTLRNWPQNHVVKCLVSFHPDEAVESRLEQEAKLQHLYSATQASGHELLLEIVLPKDKPRGFEYVFRAVKRLYNIGIFPDWWKLEPILASQWKALDALIQERDDTCRGVLILGLNAPLNALVESFAEAKHSQTCQGFAVGRTLFDAPARDWFQGKMNDADLISKVQANFQSLSSSFSKTRSKESK